MKLTILTLQFFILFSSYAKVNAVYHDDIVEISWTNPMHIKVDYFYIERSKNGKNFKEIIKINGDKENYNINQYYEVDNKPFNKKGYYRIKQVDINGNVYYSNVVFAKNNKNITPLFNLLFTNQNKQLKDYKANNVLVVLIDKDRNEFIAKVDLEKEAKELIITSSNVVLPTGKYLITATSDDTIYGKQIISKGNYFNPLQTQHIK